MYIYVIEYDGKLSLEGYNTIDKAIERLKNQEYIQEYGLIFKYKALLANFVISNRFYFINIIYCGVL